jgi:flagellar hook-basal body complex protein FliE
MAEFPIKPVGANINQPEVERPGSGKGSGTEPGNFSDTLKEALREVNDLQNRSAVEIEGLVEGDLKDVHSAMLALQKADLSFQLMLQVRNKLVQAYRDIMRMS